MNIIAAGSNFLLTMVVSTLAISISIPLVFSIGMILVVSFRRRIITFDLIKNMVIIVIQVSALILSVIYLCLRDISIAEFFRKLLVLYFPIIFLVFGYSLSVYQTFLTLLLLSIDASILHTEVEAIKDPSIIVACSFYIFFS